MNGRDFVVEESPWKTRNAMLDVNALGLSVGAFGQVAFEGSRAELVGVDLRKGSE